MLYQVLIEEDELPMRQEMENYQWDSIGCELKSGESITQFIARHKMKVIDRIMQESSHTINEIAEKAGFESRTYFNRFVEKIYWCFSSGVPQKALCQKTVSITVTYASFLKLF